MTNATHAVHTRFRLDPAKRAEQERGLRAVIVPGVQRAPGFVSGLWLQDEEGVTSTVVVAFSSADAAESFRAGVVGNAANQAAAGIEIVQSDVLRVTASASAP